MWFAYHYPFRRPEQALAGHFYARAVAVWAQRLLRLQVEVHVGGAGDERDTRLALRVISDL